MAPLLTLLLVTLLARGVGALGVGYVATWPDAVAVGLAAMFLLTASAHWTQPRRDGLIAIVPPSLPAPTCWSRRPGRWRWRAPSGCSCRRRGWRRPSAWPRCCS